MNKRLDTIRAKAIEVREKLSYASAEDQGEIARMDRIIRGAVLVKWTHLIAALAFVAIAAVFTYLVYPNARLMMLMLGISACGYAVCWIGIMIQIKIYDNTIGKVRSALEDKIETLVEVRGRPRQA